MAICRVEAAEIDEMQSFVGKKADQRWLWHAIDHDSSVALAYTLGTRKDEVFLELKRLLAPFGIRNTTSKLHFPFELNVHQH